MPPNLPPMPQFFACDRSPSSEMSFPVAELLAEGWCTPRADMTCLSPLSILVEKCA